MDSQNYTRVYDAIVNLYEELCDHPEIAQHFIGVNIEKLVNLQTQFISKALGYQINYTGKPMYRAHHHLKITDFQYDEVSKIFVRLFEKHNFKKEEVDKIKEVLINVRPMVVSSKWCIVDQLVKPFYFVINYFEDILRKRGATD